MICGKVLEFTKVPCTCMKVREVLGVVAQAVRQLERRKKEWKRSCNLLRWFEIRWRWVSVKLRNV